MLLETAREEAHVKFGKALKEFRTARKMSQQELADAVGVNQTMISQVESGRRPGFSREVVAAVEAELGLLNGELFAHLPDEHPAREVVEVPDCGLVWGSPPRDVPEPEPGKTYKLTGRFPPGTFVLKVSGHSVHGYGVHDGDVIAVRPSTQPEDGSLVVARQGNAYTLKGCLNGRLMGFGRDDDGPTEVDNREEFQVVGVMLWVVEGHRRFAQRPRLVAKPPKPKKK
jgi:transcriptional regulator with XRE-family HTH domain